ncbi:MAG TPA: T9SS type A sorting domain-containing protein [Puia sp.]|jgi:hypothetical protein
MNKLYLLLISVFSMGGAFAQQSPGGVSANLSLWLRADAASTLSPSSGSLNSWTYFNNSNAFTASPGSQPVVAPASINFLPSVAFSGTQFMVGPNGPGASGAPIAAGSKAYSVFAVWQSSTAIGGPNERIWSQRPNSNAPDGSFDGASLWVFPSGPAYGDQPEVSPFTTGVATAPAYTSYILPYAPNTVYISQMNFLAQDANDLELVDQSNLATAPGVTSTDPAGAALTNRNLTDAFNILGARSTSLDEPFIGNLAELIIYTGPISGTARNQVFSYLAMKYGIATNASLVSSGGVTTWDATANGAYGFNSFNYNNFVFGIGMDNGSGLSVSQSNSLATGSGNGTGQSGKGNIVLSNPTALADQGFMVVGSNNAGFAETTTNLSPLAAAGSQRLGTQWLVQHSGTVGHVDMSFDFTGITTTGTIGTTTDFRLLVDQDGDGDFTTGGQGIYTPTSFSGNVAQFTDVDLTQSSKVVISILSSAGPGTPLPVNWVNFTAKPAGGDVDLNWTVSANESAKTYDVQHSTDGVTFKSIGQVANLSSVQSYSFVHTQAGEGIHYYRILETDLDGKSIYSKIVSASVGGGDFSIRLLNNPVTGGSQDAELEISALKAGNASLELWSLAGARVAVQMATLNAGTSRIRIPLSGVPAGTYAVKIRINDITRVVQVVKL